MTTWNQTNKNILIKQLEIPNFAKLDFDITIMHNPFPATLEIQGSGWEFNINKAIFHGENNTTLDIITIVDYEGFYDLVEMQICEHLDNTLYEKMMA